MPAYLALRGSRRRAFSPRGTYKVSGKSDSTGRTEVILQGPCKRTWMRKGTDGPIVAVTLEARENLRVTHHLPADTCTVRKVDGSSP